MRVLPFCSDLWGCSLSLSALKIAGIAAMLLLSVQRSRAEITLAYSFETGLEGFGPNGGGVTVALDTIGATEGVNSLRMSIVNGATFVGALTGTLTPNFGDPPGMDAIVFDLTITQEFPNNPGDFVDAGITVFGASQPDYPGGQLQGLGVQFLNYQVPLGDLEVGTHEIIMPLTSATHPLTFNPGSFNDIFGGFGTGADDVIPTGFQIYINKSATAPWTGYIDNIRVGMLPPPVDADFNDDTFVDAADLAIWEGAFGNSTLGDANSDGVSDGADFLIWQQQLTPTAAPFGPVATVPEPSSLAIGAAALMAVRVAARRRSSPLTADA